MPLDTSTSLPRGAPFTGPAGLKELLLSRADQFARATVSRMMVYALGRKLEKSDETAVERIVTATKEGGYRFDDIIFGIVDSAPFQMRQSAALQTASLTEKPQ